jgi:hypothetical protein
MDFIFDLKNFNFKEFNFKDFKNFNFKIKVIQNLDLDFIVITIDKIA